MKRIRRTSSGLFIAICLLLLLPLNSKSQNLSFSGQLSAFHLSKIEKPWQSVSGIRYIPELKWNTPINKTWKFDLEASANLYGHADIQKDSFTGAATLKPYRIWGRLATERFELRLGLQKISFGSATMLRPLMWFDHLDPCDPLQLTDGVYAALGRYFFQNNANIWIWGIVPAKTVKGWEVLTSDQHRPEFGGRFQTPAGRGELAVSGHFRYIGTDQSDGYFPVTINSPVPEYRIALDGKWDVGPGIWFEGTYNYHQLPEPAINHTRMLTLGADYTFGMGNGLTAMAEQFFYQTGPELLKNSSDLTFTAASVTYPLSITHSLSGMVFYNWTTHDWYRFVNWRISLNKISLHLIAFCNPVSFDLYRNTGNANLMGGRGIQIMFVWNH